MICQKISFDRYNEDLQRYGFSTVLQSIFGGHFQSAAAGHFHSEESDALNVIESQDFRKLFAVIYIVQLGAAWQAVAETVTVIFAGQFCLSVYDVNGTLVTCPGTESTAVTFFIVNPYDFPDHICKSPLIA